MSRVDLTPVSYLVLGLVARDGPCTPYELKVAVSKGIARLWPFPHSQLYSEPARLAAAGLLQEKREEGGRRRRTFRLTEAGRRALREWLADPEVDEPPQIRDLAILKLYFGHYASEDDVTALARAEVARHRRGLDELKDAERRLSAQEGREHQRAVVGAAIEHARVMIAFWRRVAERPPGADDCG